MLVVDGRALRAVHPLDLLDEVLLHLAEAADAQHVLRVHLAGGQLLTDGHAHAVADVDAGALVVLELEPRAAGDRVLQVLPTVVADDDDLARTVAVLDAHDAVGLGDRGLALGLAGLEELGDAGQTLRDVVAGHTTGVEGTHRELGAGLADRLGRDDADGLADVHRLAGGQRAAVAHGAGADRGLTGEHGADLHLGHAGLDQRADLGVAEVSACGDQHGALRVDGVDGQGAGVDGGLDVSRLLDGRVLGERLGGNPDRATRVGVCAGRAPHRDHLGEAALGLAVLLADDHVLRHVHETTGQVTRVGGAKRRIGLALTAAVRRDEVLENREPLAEVRLDRPRDDVALRVGHEASHGGDLTHLRHVSSGARVDHHEDGVVGGEVLLHRLGQLGRRVGPDRDQLLAALVLGHRAALVEAVDLRGTTLVAVEDLGLLRRGLDVGDRHGHAGERCPAEAHVLQRVQRGGDDDLRVALGQVVDDLTEDLLADDAVHVAEVVRQRLVEEGAAQRRLQQDRAVGTDLGAGHHDVAHQDADLGADLELAEIQRHDRLGHRREHAALALARTLGRQEVVADDHVLGRHGDGATVGRLQDVVRRQHQDAGLGLGLGRQRQVHGHLVAVEVGVERRADERVDLDGLALDQLRLERLDAEAVQRGRAVQQHRVLRDDLLQHVPHDRALALDHALGGLDVLGVVEVVEALHHERLEQLERHGLGQAALVQLELRADHDDRTARVVDALAEQVLAEAALLALQHVRDGLQRAVAGARDRASAAAVVEQRVDGLLEHALLVVHDDLGGAEVEQSLQAVVAVDDAAVQVVQVRRREAAAVELHHGTQVRRDDRDGVEHHGGGVVLAVQERADDAQALERAGLALPLAGGDDLAQVLRLGLQVERLEALLDGLGAHGALEVLAVLALHLAVERLVALEVLDLEGLEARPHLVDTVELTLRAGADEAGLLLGGLAHLALDVGLGALLLELGEVLLQLAHALFDVGVATGGDLLGLHLDLGLQRGEVAVAGLVVDGGDHVRGEVDDLLEVLRGDVEQVAEPAGDALEVPDVGHGRGELDVSHALAAHVGPGHLDAAALADDALEADPLVLAAVALPVAGRAEDLLAEEAVALGLERAVVDGLRLLDLAVRPLADLLGARESDPQLIVEVHVQHVLLLFPLLIEAVGALKA